MSNNSEVYREKILSQYTDESFDSSAVLTGLFNNNAHTPMECAMNYKCYFENAAICVYSYDSFPDHFENIKLLRQTLNKGYSNTYSAHPELRKKERERWSMGIYRAEIDFDHVSPDWKTLLELGWAGLAERLILTEQNDYTKAAVIACRSMCTAFARLADELYSKGLDEIAKVTSHLATGAPHTLHEALELIFFTHRILDYEVACICTLGGLDRLLGHFTDADITEGRLTRETAVELFTEFFMKYDASVRANPQSVVSHLGKSYYIGGLEYSPDDCSGRDITNETTYIIIDAAVKAGVLSPKMSVRLSEKTPEGLYDRIAHFIRDENGHAVLCGDSAAMKGLQKVGISEYDSFEYAPIGCYEPAVVGREVGCTGATSLNIMKGVELALNRGVDMLTGKQAGVNTPDCNDFPDYNSFMDAVKLQIAYISDEVKLTQRTWEHHYHDITPALLLSATMETCVSRGKSAYNGGAMYSNTACNCGCIGSAADSLLIIKRYVFERHELTLPELRDILLSDWDGHEALRQKIRNEHDKWGNNYAEVDTIAEDLAEYTAAQFNGQPNGRGGCFKAGLYSIDRAYSFGHTTAATPDGRKAHDVLSKNLCCTAGMDYNGVTAEIGSVLRLDHSDYPNGSVLDLMMHPSSIKGEDGLQVLKSLIRTYIIGGGFGIQFNIFDAQTLRAAQLEPEKYRNLQIRLCGWNAYFVSLTKEQQDVFILEAESADK